MKRVSLVVCVLLAFFCARSQSFAPIEKYLVDSLELDKLSATDLQLLDSCLSIYHVASTDLERIESLNGICEHMMSDNWEKYQYYQYELLNDALASSEREDPKLLSLKSDALNNIGYIHMNRGQLERAMNYYQQSLQVKEQLNTEDGMAQLLNNIGLIYNQQGNVPKALEAYERTLEIQRKTDDKRGMAYALNNIGLVHKSQDNWEEALKFYKESLEIRKEIGNKKGIAISLNAIGVIYRKLGNVDQALNHLKKGLALQEAIGDKHGMATSLANIGSAFDWAGNTDTALVYFQRSILLFEEVGDKRGLANGVINIGHDQLRKGDIELATATSDQALQLSGEIGSPNLISRSAELDYLVQKKAGNWKQSLASFELFITMRDSIANEKNQKAAIRQQTKYEFEKAQLIKEQEEKEAARIAEERTSRRNNLQYSIIFLGILMFFGAILGLGFIKVSPTVAEGLIFFAFLIFFEFLLVLGDPYVESITGGEPIYKLLANALLAGLIFPAHAFFERALKRRLVK